MIEDVKLAKAYGATKNGGSLVGVCNKKNLSYEKKQLIAFQASLPETVFIENSKLADFKFEFFTPLKETNMCGIGVIGGFTYLIDSNLVDVTKDFIVETKAGLLKVYFDTKKNIFMTCPKENFYEFDSNLVEKLLDSVSLDKKDLGSDNIEIVSVGVPKVLIEVKSMEILDSLNVDFDKLKKISDLTHSAGFYFYTKDTRNKINDYYARQFNPLFGIDEDPITGVAAGALGAYVKKYGLSNKRLLRIEQGFLMNSPGIIKVKIKDKIDVGGRGILVK